MVKAILKNSYGYRDPVTGERTYYGPGEVDIPEGLARTLGVKTEPPVEPVPEPDELTGDWSKDLPEEWYTAGAAVSHVGYPDDTPEILPDDFPGREYLAAAGYTTVYQVKALTFDDLTALPGIGRATARRIMSAIGELE